jgi:regulator of protease activity HflC (stomatin/prohibitin superfamily)
MIYGPLIVLIVILLVALITSLKSFGINQEYQRGVLFRLGRLGQT